MIDESSIDVYRRSKHLTMIEAKTLIKRGFFGGWGIRLSQTLRCGQVVVRVRGIDVEGWYLRKVVVGMNNLLVTVIVIVWNSERLDVFAERWTK